MKNFLPTILFLTSLAEIPAAQAAEKADEEAKTFRKDDFSIRPRLGIRLRDELRENLNLDQNANWARDRERLLLRLDAAAEMRWKWLELTAGLTDSRELIHETASATAELDITRLYLGLHNPGGIPLWAKLGRQNLGFASQRLVSSSSWSNKNRSWDGLSVGTKFSRMSAAMFAASVVEIESGSVDYGDWDETLWGAQVQAEITSEIHIDVYIYGLYKNAWVNEDSPIRGEDGAIGDENRVTPGIRIYGKHDSPKLAWEVEAAFQVGHKASDSIHAFAIAANIDWTMPLANAPKIGLDFNYASGDPDPDDSLAQTFVPLYGTTHSPFGIADLFRWQNMFEVAPWFSAALHPKLTLRLEQHTYWLAETADAWVNSSGKVLRQGKASASNYAGQEWSIIAVWRPLDSITVEGGFSKFIPGKFMRDTGDVKGASFGYLSGAFKY